MSHTCGIEPDKKSGRIVPECELCYDEAADDGFYLGQKHMLDLFTSDVQDMIKKEFNPLDEDDAGRAQEKWYTARTMLSQMERIRNQRNIELQKDHTRKLDWRLSRIEGYDSVQTTD